jgi:NitT/TauT family transport system permease protein
MESRRIFEPSRLFNSAISLVIVAVVAALFLRYGHRASFNPSKLRLSAARMPYYAFCSFSRVLIAYLLSLLFAVVYGMSAAKNPLRERIMVPIIDVAQSVPVIGFFPAALYFFIGIGGSTRLGVEVAAIFLIFTSQAWNMALGVFEAVKTIPGDIDDALCSFGAEGWLRFRRLLLPASVPKLVYNSILSWVAAWYFLIACEIITVGDARYRLPGLGSVLMESVEEGHIGDLIAALAWLLLIIVTMDLIVWQPLSVWAEKFRYEFAAGSTPLESLAMGNLLRPFGRRVVRAVIVTAHSARPMLRKLSWLWPLSARGLTPLIVPWLKIARRALFVAMLALLAYGACLGTAALIRMLIRPWPATAKLIPLAAGASILRLTVAYTISLAWTLPCALAAGESARFSRWLTPFAEIAGSVPATALFPLIVAAIVRLTGNMNFASILLLLTGMQWYLLFNLTAGVRQVPEDLREAARAFGLSRFATWRKLVLPALTPSLITGSITAWGGGWNALIVSEYFVYHGERHQVLGLGALLDVATYQTGDNLMLLLALLSMVLIVMCLNRLAWRPLYRFATERYRFD